MTEQTATATDSESGNRRKRRINWRVVIVRFFVDDDDRRVLPR